MKKLTIPILCIILVFLVVGCGTTPTPAPTVTITSQVPAPTQAPSTHPIVQLEILSSTFGQAGYILPMATADLLKKNHPWLRANVAETPGYVYNLESLVNNPSMWNNTVIGSNTETIWLARKGMDPFTTSMPAVGMRKSMTQMLTWFGIVTLDPNIKTLQDLEGKKLALGLKTQIGWWKLPEWVMGDGLGILDRINVENMKPADMGRYLLDGMVDACMVAASMNPYTKQWSWQGPSMELANSGKKFSYINYGSKEALDKVQNEVGIAVNGVTLAAGTLPDQTSDVFGIAQTGDYWVKDVFPEDIAYEFTKFNIQNHDKYGDYLELGKMMSPEYMAFGITKRNGHPGAVRAYEEAGIKIPES